MGFSDVAHRAQLAGTTEARGARAPQGRRHRAGLQARRHLRRRVRVATRPTSTRPTRASARPTPTDRRKVMILGSGPNRIGQGIEFDYCCCHAAFALQGGGLRDHHGQLQPRDGLDRLRHLRPALLRAAHVRGRDEHHRDREARGRRRPVRRADAAEPGAAAARGRRPDPRHQPRRDRPRRGPQALRRAPRRARHPAARERHRHLARGGEGGGRRASATRCWCGRPTCSAGAPWRSSTTRAASSSTCARR